MAEIDELRHCEVEVIAGTARWPDPKEEARAASEIELGMIALRPLRPFVLARAFWMIVKRWPRVADLVRRIMRQGNESLVQRSKALLHTWIGAYYALLLEQSGVRHIHVHHGYFGSWIAMVAARLQNITFSMTLHGSDLLLHGAFLDTKLKSCSFCLTVSEFNRRFICQRYPEVDPGKLALTRLGVDVPDFSAGRSLAREGTSLRASSPFTLLSVGRLHPVKDHAFLLRACSQLRAWGLHFECLIAGEGPRRRHLHSLIRKCDLENTVTLLGHVPREQMDSLYSRADVVVLTSRSEGIPLVLMEAMARGRIVVAPAITGIPELVVPGKTGFLYEPGNLGDFVARILFIHSLIQSDLRFNQPAIFLSSRKPLDWMKHAATSLVRHNFSRSTNLEFFAEYFIHQIAHSSQSS